jgi:hypothetical protein
MDIDKNINDDFLKRFISLSADEEVPEGFSERVMQQLPAVQEQPIAADASRRWIWLSIAAAVIAILVALSFGGTNIFARFASAEGFQIYRQLFGSVVGSFSKGFSSIHISSIGVLILISTLLLYLTNLLLRRWFDQKQSAT